MVLVKRFRSPPYPYLSLSKSIERVNQLFLKAQHYPVGINVLASAWSMSHQSGSLLKSAAALLQYGLIKDQGSGETRKFQLTEAARRILQDADPASEKRRMLIKTAALAPSIHKELWEKFGDATQLADPVLKNHLLFDRREMGEALFSENSATEVIQTYRDAISFAKLDQAEENLSSIGDDSSDDITPPVKPENNINAALVSVGDMVQWESNGVLQFENPRRVRWTSDDGGWIAVEGSNTGIPSGETILEQKFSALPNVPREQTAPPPPAPITPSSLGAKEWIRTALGAQTSVNIYANGPIGPKEIGKLIKLLEVQKSILEED